MSRYLKINVKSESMIWIGKYQFEGPWRIEDVDFLDRACVYAILCKSGDGYTPIYIGETGRIGTRLSTHHRRDCWKRKCRTSLYIALYWTPSDQYSPEERKEIERELIEKYDPPCNRQ